MKKIKKILSKFKSEGKALKKRGALSLIHTEVLKTPPVVPGLPVVGNAFSMLKDPVKFLYDCYRKYGPVYRLRILNKSCTVLAGIEATNFIGNRESLELLDTKEIWQGLNEELQCKHAMITQNGEVHQKLRAALYRGYSKEAFKGRYDELVHITRSIIRRDWPVGQLIPAVRNLRQINVEQVGSMLMTNFPPDCVDDLLMINQYILNIKVLGNLPKFLLKNPSYKRAKKNLTSIANQMIAEHQLRKNAGDLKYRTILDDLMETHALDPELITLTEMSGLLIGTLFAGADSVSMTTAAFIYHVLKNPEIHALVCAEADALFAKQFIDEDDLLNMMPVLNGALMETMRMNPVLLSQIRLAKRDFSFLGYKIQAGERLYIATAIPHFMEEYFPNPATFDVNRYAKPRSEHLKSGAYSPFGRGSHMCVGQTFAKVQMLLTMAQLFHELELELESPNYELALSALPAPGPSKHFKVRVKKRRH